MEGYAAVVTGGAQGIGKGIALALSGAGMHVVILDVNRRAGRETAAGFMTGTQVVIDGGLSRRLCA